MLVKTLRESLPQRAYSATQVLENEAKIALSQAISMTELMEKAGRACFSFVYESYQNVTNMLVLCGKGNNGGDGFVIARLAQEMGINVTVYLCTESEQLAGEAKVSFDKLQKTNATIIYQSEYQLSTEFLQENSYEIIIDALFGIGFKGQLTPELIAIIHLINRSHAKVISVDIPSGVEATTGHVSSTAIMADFTITFIVVKQGLLTGQAANYVGEILLADLTIGEAFQQVITSLVEIQGELNSPKKPKRSAVSHKGDIGLLLAIGGNQGMPGAIRLASESALRAGAALVAVCCHKSNQSLVLSGRPELMFAVDNASQLTESHFFHKAKQLICGPGLGQDAWSKTLFDCVLASEKSCVLDADALHLLALSPKKSDNWILTPHPGEAAVLLNCTIAEIEQDRFTAVRNIALQYGGICLLKGAGSLISDGKNVWINTSGNSGMASGGMGDVLSGIIAALVMQLSNVSEAVRLAVYLHGRAADIIAEKNGKIGMLASDLLPIIQKLINQGDFKYS
ncbi:NAD(P)H-hydrate dehydratase [Colwelliaceae bacterium 6441]